jgi:hypothetical protein
MALVITSSAGVADAAIACVCPDGEVGVEAAWVCSCCYPADSDGIAADMGSASGNPSCSDCVDVPLRMPPTKNDHPRLHAVTVEGSGHSTPIACAPGFERERTARPDQGHRLTLALLASVVLLT